MSGIVLDASALMALLLGEPGADAVEASLDRAIISTVNLAEVAGKLAERGMPEAEIHQVVETLGLETTPFDEDQAYLAGDLRPSTRAMGLSLGDRACLALGRSLGAEILTADTAWRALGSDLRVTVIR